MLNEMVRLGSPAVRHGPEPDGYTGEISHAIGSRRAVGSRGMIGVHPHKMRHSGDLRPSWRVKKWKRPLPEHEVFGCTCLEARLPVTGGQSVRLARLGEAADGTGPSLQPRVAAHAFAAQNFAFTPSVHSDPKSCRWRNCASGGVSGPAVS